MGLNFSKEMQLATQQIYPAANQAELTSVQDRLIKKLGANSYPFAVTLPESAPASVQLHSGDEDSVSLTPSQFYLPYFSVHTKGIFFSVYLSYTAFLSSVPE